MEFLALDIGSSFIKYAILDLESNSIRGRGKRPFPLPLPEYETRSEISAEEIWNIVKTQIDSMLEQEEALSGILLCTQMHGFILADREGTAMTPYISWQDSRCTELCDTQKGMSWIERLEELGCSRLMTCAGVSLKPNLSMCNLYVMMNEIEFPPNVVHFCTLGSYLIFKLTGRNVCHITNGAPTGLADIVHGTWNKKLIEAIGADRFSFPLLSTKMEACGTYKKGEREILVYPDLGDHQACVLGSLARPGKDVNINIGTAGLLGMITSKYNWKTGEVRPYCEGMYLNTLRGLCGGRDLEILVKFFADTVNAVSGQKVECKAVWDIISTPQEETPVHCCGRQLDIQPGFYEGGSIGEITQHNFSFSSLLDAVYQKIAEEYHEAVCKILPQGEKIEHIVYSGGAARKNPRLMERIAKEIGCGWQEAPVEDEALLGLYRIALLLCGKCKTLEETVSYIQRAIF